MRLLALFLLVVLSLGTVHHLYSRWQRVEKKVVVIMRSSNEDCDDEFRGIWKIERVVKGNLTAAEAASLCYSMNSRRAYSKHDSIEWIRVEGTYTNEDGQAFYADCMGTKRFWDSTVKPLSTPPLP